MTALTTIRNIGPAIEKEFLNAGITSAEQLRNMGVDAAYAQLLQSGTRPHFIGYYILHMGLQGRPWNDCKSDEKKELRQRFDKIVAENKQQNDMGIEKILDEIGIGLRG